MSDLFKTTKITQANPSGPLQEQLVGAVQVSGGAADAGKVVLLNSLGQIDPSMGGGGGGAFNDITTGTNTSATMTVGSGAEIITAGSGSVEATELATPGAPVTTNTSAPTHAGQLLISQPDLITAIWADPQVQGLYAAGSPIATPPVYTPPTTIQPVLIGGSDGTTLRNILTDSSGHLITTDTLDADASSINDYTAVTAAAGVGLTSPLLTPMPILSIQTQSGSTVYRLKGLQVFSLSGSTCQWLLVRNGTLTGASFAASTSANMYYDTSATSIAGGTLVLGGYIGGQKDGETDLLIYIASGSPGDVLSLVVTPMSTSDTVGAAMHWTEQ